MSTLGYNAALRTFLVPGATMTFNGRRAYEVKATRATDKGWLIVHIKATECFGMYSPEAEPQYLRWLETTGWDPLYDEVLSDTYILHVADSRHQVTCRNPVPLGDLAFTLEIKNDSAAPDS